MRYTEKNPISITLMIKKANQLIISPQFHRSRLLEITLSSNVAFCVPSMCSFESDFRFDHSKSSFIYTLLLVTIAICWMWIEMKTTFIFCINRMSARLNGYGILPSEFGNMLDVFCSCFYYFVYSVWLYLAIYSIFFKNFYFSMTC